MNKRFQTLFHFVSTRPHLLQSTTTRFAACSSQSSLQIAPALFLHSSASLHTSALCPVAHGFFSSRGTVLPLPLASPNHLVDHHRRSFTGGLPFLLAASITTQFSTATSREHLSLAVPHSELAQPCSKTKWCGAPRTCRIAPRTDSSKRANEDQNNNAITKHHNHI